MSSEIEPENNPIDEPRKVSSEELERILKYHQIWIATDKKEGKQADLSNAYLKGEKFCGEVLTDAIFQRAYLLNSKFGNAEAMKRPYETDVTRANFKEANLRDSNFEEAIGLTGGQFSGADLSGAKFPKTFDFSDGLKHVEEICKSAKKIFIFLILGCVFSWLTMLITTDAKLLTNSATSPLPIIQTPIPIASFYLIAPVILVALFLYFHFYLQWLWERLATFPAIFPNGNLLDEQAYPWLLNRLVRSYFYRLKKNFPPISQLQIGIMIFLVWCLVPVTTLIFWGRYLRIHHWLGTGLHIILILISIGGAIVFQRKMAFILSLKTVASTNRKEKILQGYLKTFTALGIVIFFSSLSMKAIGRLPFMEYSITPFVTANFTEEDVSTKPDNWTGKEEEIPLVKGAKLKGVDLRFARGFKSFLARADLKFADFFWAKFPDADFRAADFTYGEFVQGNFQISNFGKADLNQANFCIADLTGADFKETRFFSTNLRGANLADAENLTQEQINGTCMDEKTILPNGLVNPGCKGLVRQFWDQKGDERKCKRSEVGKNSMFILNFLGL